MSEYPAERGKRCGAHVGKYSLPPAMHDMNERPVQQDLTRQR
jgi:hypothetical protein